MFEAWREDLNGPQGERIRRRLKGHYFIIARPLWPHFICRWHRMRWQGHTDPGQVFPVNYGRHINPLEDDKAFERDRALGTLPCEPACAPWPEDISPNSLIKLELPLHVLPDGRRVFFVPQVKSYGTILPHLWGELVSSAKQARGPLLAHAYEVTLNVLQFWKKIGPRMVERRAKREELTDAAKWDYDGQVDSSGRDHMIENWVFFWARHLHENPTAKFTPSAEALEILARAVGYTASSIESIIRRESRRRVRKPRRVTRE